MNTKTLIGTLAVTAAIVTVGANAMASSGQTKPGTSTATVVHTITGSWTFDQDGGAFTANQEDGSATKVQGLEVLDSSNFRTIVNVCPAGQQWADVVWLREIRQGIDPIPGTGSPITGPYVIRTPVMKGLRTKVFADEVQPLVPVPCPDYEPATKARKLPPPPRPIWR